MVAQARRLVLILAVAVSLAFIAGTSAQASNVSLSTTVLGPGIYGDGYTNNATGVELVRFIPNATSGQVAASNAVQYTQAGATIDLSAYVVLGATAGNLGSDIHGRGAPLFLKGDGETATGYFGATSTNNNGGIGIGAHADKLVTFDLNTIRAVDLSGSTAPLEFTARFGMNGGGSPGEPVSPLGIVQGLVYLDGVQILATSLKSLNDPSQAINLNIPSGGRYLTLVIENGNNSTFYDDGTFRDATLVPEPSSIILLGLGAVSLFLVVRRRHAKV